MGQLVAVTEKPSTSPGVVRFEVNRTLAGQGHAWFGSIDDAYRPTTSDELARRLFASGRVASLHIYSNMITVDLQKGFDSEGLADVIRDMYQYWKPGVTPPSFEDLQPDEPEVDESAVAAAGGDSALTEAAKKVPMHLLVRAREARERWNAKKG